MAANIFVGNPTITVPLADAVLIHEQINGAAQNGQGGFFVPCHMQDSVALQFWGKSFTIDPLDMAILGSVDGGNTCLSSISGSDAINNNTYLVSVHLLILSSQCLLLFLFSSAMYS